MKREAAAMLFAMTFPSVMAYVYFVAAAGPATPIIYSASKVIQFGFPIVYLSLRGRPMFKPFRPTTAGIGTGTAFGLAVGAGIIWLADWLGPTVLAETPQLLRAKVSDFGVGTPGRFIAFAAFLSVIHSLAEEYYWRWFVFGRLRRLIPLWPAAAVSGVAFAGHHVFVLNEYLPGRFWSATVPFSLGIAAGGATWAWLYHRTNSLLGPWVSHFLVDCAIMFAGYRLLFG